MSLFSKFIALISNSFNRNQRERDWAKNFSNQKPAKPSHLLPLDPEDPTKT